jgi:hypothetical protein
LLTAQPQPQPPGYNLTRLGAFLLLSLLLHAALIYCLPDLTRLFNIHLRNLSLTDNLIRVKLLEPEKPPREKLKTPDKSLPVLAPERVSSLIDKRLEKLPAFPALGDAPLPPAPPLNLPEAAPPKLPDLDTLLPAATAPKSRPRELAGDLTGITLGRLSGDSRGRGARNGRVGTQVSPVAALLSPARKKSLVAVAPPKKESAAANFGLSGPVARTRRVLYRPPLPKISLTRDVSVRLRFWVRPDGSISRVETLKIGDLELVNVAEKYLQQWRFSILPAELPQKEQWGMVTVVFRVSRR